MAAFARSKPRGSETVIMGDFNADLLPLHSLDPWSDLPQRTEHHFEERHLLMALCDQFTLDVVLPDSVIGNPGGPHGAFALLTPFTRLPVGGQSCLLSLLD